MFLFLSSQSLTQEPNNEVASDNRVRCYLLWKTTIVSSSTFTPSVIFRSVSNLASSTVHCGWERLLFSTSWLGDSKEAPSCCQHASSFLDIFLGKNQWASSFFLQGFWLGLLSRRKLWWDNEWQNSTFVASHIFPTSLMKCLNFVRERQFICRQYPPTWPCDGAMLGLILYKIWKFPVWFRPPLWNSVTNHIYNCISFSYLSSNPSKCNYVKVSRGNRNSHILGAIDVDDIIYIDFAQPIGIARYTHEFTFIRFLHMQSRPPYFCIENILKESLHLLMPNPQST